MNVYVPGPLRSYTRERAQVQVQGTTVGAALADLERQFPGIRFRIINEQDRIREHIRIFVNQEPAERLETPLKESDVLHIIAALSGG